MLQENSGQFNFIFSGFRHGKEENGSARGQSSILNEMLYDLQKPAE